MDLIKLKTLKKKIPSELGENSVPAGRSGHLTSEDAETTAGRAKVPTVRRERTATPRRPHVPPRPASGRRRRLGVDEVPAGSSLAAGRGAALGHRGRFPRKPNPLTVGSGQCPPTCTPGREGPVHGRSAQPYLDQPHGPAPRPGTTDTSTGGPLPPQLGPTAGSSAVWTETSGTTPSALSPVNASGRAGEAVGGACWRGAAGVTEGTRGQACSGSRPHWGGCHRHASTLTQTAHLKTGRCVLTVSQQHGVAHRDWGATRWGEGPPVLRSHPGPVHTASPQAPEPHPGVTTQDGSCTRDFHKSGKEPVPG